MVQCGELPCGDIQLIHVGLGMDSGCKTVMILLCSNEEKKCIYIMFTSIGT